MSSDYDPIIDQAAATAKAWLAGFESRPIPPVSGIDDVRDALGRDLPEHGTAPDLSSHCRVKAARSRVIFIAVRESLPACPTDAADG